MENGNLIISPVSRDDEGVYTCTASNIYGTDESQGRLIVLRKFYFCITFTGNAYVLRNKIAIALSLQLLCF